jgi:hypothetical protein
VPASIERMVVIGRSLLLSAEGSLPRPPPHDRLHLRER